MNKKEQALSHIDLRTGIKGVRPAGGGRFAAVINKRGKIVYLGTFNTAAEAHAAWMKVAVELHGEFARAA